MQRLACHEEIPHNRAICPARAATLTDLTHTVYSKSRCGHVRKSYSKLLKYARNTAVHLQHNWQHLETNFFKQTRFFLKGVTSQSDSNWYDLSHKWRQILDPQSSLTYNLANIQNPVFNVTVGNHIPYSGLFLWGGNFREKLNKAPRIKFRAFKISRHNGW